MEMISLGYMQKTYLPFGYDTNERFVSSSTCASSGCCDIAAAGDVDSVFSHARLAPQSLRDSEELDSRAALRRNPVSEIVG